MFSFSHGLPDSQQSRFATHQCVVLDTYLSTVGGFMRFVSFRTMFTFRWQTQNIRYQYQITNHSGNQSLAVLFRKKGNLRVNKFASPKFFCWQTIQHRVDVSEHPATWDLHKETQKTSKNVIGSSTISTSTSAIHWHFSTDFPTVGNDTEVGTFCGQAFGAGNKEQLGEIDSSLSLSNETTRAPFCCLGDLLGMTSYTGY